MWFYWLLFNLFMSHRTQQRKGNRNKVRVTAQHPRGRLPGQTAKRWMRTHKSVCLFVCESSVWVFVYTGYSQCKRATNATKDNPDWVKTDGHSALWQSKMPFLAQNWEFTIEERPFKVWYKEWSEKLTREGLSVTISHWLNRVVVRRELNTDVSFIYVGYSLCELVDVKMFVCTRVCIVL